MKHSHTAPATPTTVTAPAADLQAEIRARAYELYEQRGKDEGREIDDWLQAERELCRMKATTAGT